MNTELNPDGTLPAATQLTTRPGSNSGPNWGEIKTNCARRRGQLNAPAENDGR